MKRRNFLLGTGGTAIGGSALLGSGAFTRIESQRRAKIEVAADPDAYLGLDGCPDSPNSSYTNIDGSGHLEIDMSPGNETDVGGKGINSDSFTSFDNIFEICNNGKQSVCVWIEADADPELELDSEYDDEDIVDFYVEDDRDRSIVGSENGVVLGVGACICIGISTVTKGLEEGDQLIDSDEIVIHADEGEDCRGVGETEPEEPPEDVKETAISFIAFCGADGEPIAVEDIEIIGTNDDNEPVAVRWTMLAPVQEVILKGGQKWYRYDVDGATTGTAWMSVSESDANYEGPAPFRFDDEDGPEERCPSSPCLGISGTKTNYDEEFDTTNPEFTRTTC